jgi:hypothetical protein
MENQTFILTKKLSTITFVMIAIGLLTLGASYFAGVGLDRIAANLLLNTYYC